LFTRGTYLPMKLTQPIFFLLFLVTLTISVSGQTANNQIPLSYQFNQQLNGVVYSPANKFHSAIRGYMADDPVISEAYNRLMNMGIDTTVSRSWARRKLTQEHLLDVKGEDYTVYGDIVPDFQVGRDFSGSKSTWLNTRGYQFGGTVGKKFSFYTSGYENQGVFANYYEAYIDSNNVVPGQLGGGAKIRPETKDWSYVTSLVSFTPNQYLNIALGYDKNFIGDGYRSMLLSDFSSNYSFLRLRASYGDLQYQTILAYMLDPNAERLTTDRRLGDRGKWMSANYVDWNATNRLSLGVFLSTVWSDVKESDGSSTRVGFNAKYEVLEKTALYGQVMLDKQSAWQIGLKGSDLLNVSRLNYLFEFNAAKPYAYSHTTRITSYSNYNQPLAHPMGANFREMVGILSYSYKRFNFQGQLLRATYGLDSAGTNFGKDIFKGSGTMTAESGSTIGQGVKTNLYYAQGKVAYLINPKTNLRVEVGAIARRESNSIAARNTSWLTVGLRGSFRNLYTDF
jgi:hypothetical protein